MANEQQQQKTSQRRGFTSRPLSAIERKHLKAPVLDQELPNSAADPEAPRTWFTVREALDIANKRNAEVKKQQAEEESKRRDTEKAEPAPTEAPRKSSDRLSDR